MDALVGVSCYLIVGDGGDGVVTDDAIIISCDSVIGNNWGGGFTDVDAMAAIPCYSVVSDGAGGGVITADAKPAID